jgi:hypothetical protein
MSLLSFMNAGGLQGLAKIVSLPPAAANAFLIKGRRNARSCSTLKDFNSLSPSAT